MMGPQQIWPARAVVDPVIECQTGDHHEVVPATSQDRGGQPYLRSMRPDGERQANEAHRRHRSITISTWRLIIARIQYGKTGHSKGPSSQNTPSQMLFV